MGKLDNLEPKNVFHFFEELCAIPHGSRNTKRISDYCVRFAQERGLAVTQDDANNVVIVKPATRGYENAETVILQGHLDMVTEKTADCDIDFEKDGLELTVEGDFISAVGTTLGGDDGIAVAMAMAVLNSDELPHPRLEAVFTVDEEIGMLGASALDTTSLRGRKLLNIDSEQEGILTVSCAGGATARCRIPIAWEAGGDSVAVTVTGLTGGHSGTSIDKGRANACVLLGRYLEELGRRADYRLARVTCGGKDNAIAREASAELCVERAAAEKLAAELTEIFRDEYAVTDGGVTVSVASRGAASRAMSADATRRVVAFLLLAPCGVCAMSADIEGLVQTSLNVGILETREDSVDAVFSVRSSVASQKVMLERKLERLCKTLGGSLILSGDYPAWRYRRDSSLRDTMVAVYREQYGRAPKIEAIHAGLECGILAGKLDGLDAVSYGPDIHEIHTVRERLNISSVARVWEFTKEVLRRCK